MHRFYCIADLHALTSSGENVHESSVVTARALLACGVDPSLSVLYRQSSLGSLHTQLYWLLACCCPNALLNRMTHYKDKAKLHPSRDTCALFSYPVLQAADILLFRATRVPVGHDQLQHLELCRDLAHAFQKRYVKEGTSFEPFVAPIADVQEGEKAVRVMSLKDATTKMSKSVGPPSATLFLDDTPDDIAQKIKRATTDSEHGVTYEPNKRPHLANLLRIAAGLEGNGATPEQIATTWHNADKAKFKEYLTELTITKLTPIRRYMETTSLADVEKILEHGAQKAGIVAQHNWNQIRALAGI